MKLDLQRNGELPLYRQIMNQVREYIRSGALPTGSRLPTVRELAREYGLTRLTVHTAYAELQSEGLVEAVVGRGTFVAEHPPFPTLPALRGAAPTDAHMPPPWLSQGMLADMMRIETQSDLLSFAQAIPAPETYPTVELGRSLRNALDDPAVLRYGATTGELEFREECAHLLLDRGVVTTPDQILITSGAQQAIDLALRAFTLPSSIVLVEEPTFVGILELAAQRNQRLVGVASDEQGFLPEALEAACKRYHPPLVYTMPTFHNPTGRCLSEERRQALLRLAHRYDFLIFEDDVAGALAYGADYPLALKASDPDERVIYATSYSKVLLPGLRLGMIVAPEKYMPSLLAAKRTSDLFSSPWLQLALADYLYHHSLYAHLQRVLPLYRKRRDALLAALQRFLPECEWIVPQGGLNVWVTLPAFINEHDFYLQAIEYGVGFAPGSAFYVQPPSRAHMRLSFGALPPERIEQGIETLGQLYQVHQRKVRHQRYGVGLTESFL